MGKSLEVKVADMDADVQAETEKIIVEAFVTLSREDQVALEIKKQMDKLQG